MLERVSEPLLESDTFQQSLRQPAPLPATAITLWTPSLVPCAARRRTEAVESADEAMDGVTCLATPSQWPPASDSPLAPPLPPPTRYSHPFLPPHGPGPLVVYKGVLNAQAARDAIIAQAAARCGLLLHPPRPLGPPAPAPVVIVELPADDEALQAAMKVTTSAGEEEEGERGSPEAMALD